MKEAERLAEACSRVPLLTIDGNVITLQFDLGGVQTEMSQSDPLHLVSSYTRDMSGFISFVADPRAIVMIGLGGGALAKWCLHEFPNADLTVIEINECVIRLRDLFRIPADDRRFRILCDEGANYLCSTPHRPDVLLVDGFDHEGQPPQLCTQQFYNDCFRVLGPGGVLVVNLCGLDRRTFQLLIHRIRRAFGSQVTVLPENRGNEIVFATKEALEAPFHGALQWRAPGIVNESPLLCFGSKLKGYQPLAS